MLYLSTVLPTVSYIIAIIILWQQQPCIRIRFVLSIVLFISLMFLFLPSSFLPTGEGGEEAVVILISECNVQSILALER